MWREHVVVDEWGRPERARPWPRVFARRVAWGAFCLSCLVMGAYVAALTLR